MGNDGGRFSIPTRRELVKEAAKNPNLTDLKEKQKEHLAHRWSQCPVSHKALMKPIVADYTGDLYNKDAILQFLLPDSISSVDKPEAENFIQGRIRSLKDIVEVHFEIEKDDILKTEKWLCPVTAKELGPNVRAVFLVPCGHAFAREAFEMMKDVTACPACSSEFENRDVVPILPSSDTDKAAAQARFALLTSLGLTHSLKKAPGSKKRKANGTTKVENGDNEEAMKKETNKNLEPRTSTPKSDSVATKYVAGIKNAATASLTAKVLEEEAARKKRRLENENLKSLYNKNKDSKVKDGEFMTRGFSIPATTKQA